MGTPIIITIPHRLDKAEARARLRAGFDRLKTEMSAGLRIASVHQAWEGDRLSFHASALGQSMTGRIDVGDREVRIELDLPALLAAFADAIAGRLSKTGRLLLEKK
jgi:hypothetical protein